MCIYRTVLGALAVGCGQMQNRNQLLVCVSSGRLMTVSCVHCWSAVSAVPLLVCCQCCAIAGVLSVLCHCWCAVCTGCRDFSNTGADIQKVVVSHSRNWHVSETAGTPYS